MRRESDAKLPQRLRLDLAPLGVKQRMPSLGRGERLLEETRRRLESIEKPETLLVDALELRVGLGQRQTRFTRELLDGFGEAQPFRLHDEGEDVAMLARREVVIEALLVIDGEGRRLLAIER